jgi:hypothetical protein
LPDRFPFGPHDEVLPEDYLDEQEASSEEEFEKEVLSDSEGSDADPGSPMVQAPSPPVSPKDASVADG